MLRFIVLSAVFGCATPLVLFPSNTNCVSWDDRIEKALFQPLRRELARFDSEYKDFTSADYGWLRFGVNWQGGTSGNYSSFRLNEVAGVNASGLCESSSTDRILAANIKYDELRAVFKNVEIYTPFFSLGDYEATVSFKGVKIYGYINAKTEVNTKTCKASLGWFLLEGFDSIQLETDGGIFSWFATKIFNYIASPRIAAFLTSYAENQSISWQVMQFLAPAVQAESEFFCKAISP